MTNTDITIQRYDDAAPIDDLEPLWSALREHHGAVAPHLGPTRERADSWEVRSASYRSWLSSKPGSFVLIARENDAAVGYALVTVHRGGMATWDGDFGCLETLSVLPGIRGGGLGTRLITAARAGLADQGIEKMTIEVVAGNDDALRFYRRHGFEPLTTSLLTSTAPDA